MGILGNIFGPGQQQQQPGVLGGGMATQPPMAPPPRIPFAQNQAITMAALGMLGAPSLNQGLQRAGQMAPIGMAANAANQDRMVAQQDQSRQRAAMSAGLKLMSGIAVTPEEQAAYDAAPEIAMKFEAMKPQAPQPTDDMREFEFGQKNPDFNDYQLNQKRAGGTNVTTNVAGEGGADGALRTQLSKDEGTRWSTIQKTGNIAASRSQDFEVMGELLKVAPQGPITGKLAEMFPGFSSAGDAVNAIVYRLAPTLRVEGSGATSDLEYNGMLSSIPSLSKNPLGNQIILETMKAKAAVDMERASIVTAYQNEEMSAADARRAMGELDRKSILTPQARSLINAAAGQDQPTEPVPEGVDFTQEVWDEMSPEQKALFK